MKETPTVQCSRCLVSFEIRACRKGSGEYTHCNGPKCNVRFWHCKSSQTLAAVGVNPEDRHKVNAP